MNSSDDLEQSIERMHVPTSAETDEWVLNDAFAALEESTQLLSAEGGGRFWQILVRSWAARLTAAALIILTALVSVYIFVGPGEDRRSSAARQADQVRSVASRDDVVSPDVKLGAELRRIERQFNAGDIDGLVEILQQGQFASKIVSAYYLAKIGDSRALGALEELKAEYGQEDPNNPFGLAAEIIKKRLGAEKEAAKAVAEAKEPVTPGRTEEVLDFSVVHKNTLEPMLDVKLDIKIQKEGPDVEREQITDQQGRCRIQIGATKPNYLRIKATAEGFVPMQVTYRKGDGVIDIPSSYTLALEPGTSIGGVVQNQHGEPIEGVAVYLLVPGEGDMERVAIWDHRETTNADGFWRCDIMPFRLDDVWVRLAHPDYIDDQTYGDSVKASVQELRSMGYIAIMKKGLAVVGRVTDANGQPIQGGSIAQGSDRWGSHYPSTKTDTQGRFEFENAKPGEMVLTVQAEGYGPQLREITVYEGMEAIELRLGRGHIIRGRIVDSEDRPVEGAFVVADTWRGHRSLHWRVNTDAQGRFEWNEGPADEVQFDMGKQGFMSVRNYAMTPSKDEYVVVMYRPFTVSGKVTDVETGERIGEFELIPGSGSGEPGSTFWQRRNTRRFVDGSYKISFDEPRDGYLIRIEAEGYLPATSPVFTDDLDQVFFDFQLKRGEGPNGIVYLPNGEPAVGAEVVLCTPSQGALIQNGEVAQKRDKQIVEAGSDGRFSFPPQNEPYLLVVLADEGYAEITEQQFALTGQITLKPWGRVEGVFRIGPQPGANERITLSYDRPYEPNIPGVSYRSYTLSDANGHFVLDKLPPGKARLAHEIQLSSWRSTYSRTQPVDIEAGETVRVTMGGTGRAILGHLVVPYDYKDPIDWTLASATLRLKLPEPSPPQNFDQMSDEEKATWREQWQESEEGRNYLKMLREKSRFYHMKLNSDGTFRAEDVPAGSYTLAIAAYQGPRGRYLDKGDLIGGLNYDLQVPDANDQPVNEPLDVGVLEIEIFKRLKVGDTAPVFEAESPDGTQIRLSDYRGKFVLLVFWMSKHPECLKEIQPLKDIHTAFGKDERFVLVGLSLDDDISVAEKFAEDNELKWQHGFLGASSKTSLTKEYGVQRLPATFLIDPDGKIIATNPIIGQLESILQNALEM